MRVVFCGSGSFAVPSLEAILQSGRHEIVGIVTQPARPAGRGGKLAPTPVTQAAGKHGLPICEIEKINAPESVAAVVAMRGDVMCVCDFGQLIRKPVRDAFPLGAFNLHGSVLPELRGAAPVNWAIIRGYAQTGVTTFSLVDKMDAGPVYLTADAPIDPRETALELRGRLARIGADLVCRTLDLLAAGQTQGRPQDESKVTLAPKLAKEQGIIDWNSEAVSIRNLIHGTWPWPGAQAVFCGGKHKDVRVAIARASVEGGGVSGKPGLLDADLCVGTAAGRLRILELQPAGKRLMAWRDFVNGYRLAAGDRFSPP